MSHPRPRLSHKVCLLLGLALLALGACVGGEGADWVYAQTIDGISVPETPGVSSPPVQPSIPMSTPAPPISQTVSTVAPPGQALILAHYMTWFKTRAFSGRWEHWQWDPNGNGQFDLGDSLPDQVAEDGLRQIAAVDYPLIGPYDSSDPAVIEYQIASAWAAGIDGFVIDWYGPQDDGGIDHAFEQTLDAVDQWQRTHGLSFFVGLAYEEKILLGVDAADRQTQLTAHLTQVLTSYATQPAYLTFRGLPVIFYFQAWQDGKPGLLSPQQLAQVRRNLPPHYLLYMGAEIEFLDVVDGFFSWISGANDNPLDWGEDYANWVYPEMDLRTRLHALDLTVGSVWPAFDDSRVGGWGNTPRSIDGQGGAVYDQTWDLALKAQAQEAPGQPTWVQIVTWNDWNEGTQIEPTLAGGTDLLAATQDKARAYTGRDMPPSALEIPARILALRREAPGPQTEALIRQVYARFFAQDFEAALSLLNE
ncbi:MAG: hypothetical protein KBG20_03625 [Caldilineaceae bacterium]|nr:hypothetical protein [Caldilineaceae bacterium]MBP8107575.1 hypothetical protein [Caldilineaceae bacterium]MBP8123816.1 hypothetical protein [Caldilineaceae bacterium]MBP9071358.1 hypothetical protein [Caldilineaceae bacterium]